MDYGLEIECILPQGTQADLATAITAAGVPCYFASYSHAQERTKWKIVTDASIHANGRGTGVELVSPPLTESHFENVRKVCAVLQEQGCTVNRSCGLHVHIGARNLSVEVVKRLAMLYIQYEAVIDQLLPPSRRASNNAYCASNATRANLRGLTAATTFSAISTAIQGDDPRARFVKLNLKSYWRHGTVEFRHHSGTIDANKILYWVQLIDKMVAAASADNAPLETMVSTTGIPLYWSRGRRRRTIYQMLVRPEGATREEVRVALGLRTRPLIRNHLRQVGASTLSFGRRNGHDVFQLPPGNTAPTTLEGMLDKLRMTDDERAFWQDRAATLTGEQATATDIIARAPRGGRPAGVTL
jgi:Putative amidoligase enzyme